MSTSGTICIIGCRLVKGKLTHIVQAFTFTPYFYSNMTPLNTAPSKVPIETTPSPQDELIDPY
jgi:hypothetical protein